MTLLLVAIGLSVGLARHSWSSGAVFLFMLLLAVPGVAVDALVFFALGGKDDE
jgi:ABC-type Fe3+ transport system permease subunit